MDPMGGVPHGIPMPPPWDPFRRKWSPFRRKWGDATMESTLTTLNVARPSAAPPTWVGLRRRRQTCVSFKVVSVDSIVASPHLRRKGPHLRRKGSHGGAWEFHGGTPSMEGVTRSHCNKNIA